MILFPSKAKGLLLGTLLAVFMRFALQPSTAVADAPKTFPSPQEAAAALVEKAKSGGIDGVLSILGQSSKDWLASGDSVQDEQGLSDFITAFEKKNTIEKESDGKAVLVIGDDDFPFPFPIVKSDTGWMFDPEEGKDELLSRRIGENELDTIQVLLAIVDAQNEYAAVDRDGDGLLEYAQTLRSSPGKRDGLYWPTAEGEPPSPMGSLVAEAASQGYKLEKEPDAGPKPFHGYFFKLLIGQGEAAPDGARAYIVNGKMIGGFAVLAYPARYGNSGIMTFMVSHEGTVYDADFGPETAEEVKTIDVFDPGEGWEKVKVN